MGATPRYRDGRPSRRVDGSPNAVLFTYPLKHIKGMCTQALNPVTFSIAAEVAHDAQAIVVYTVDERTNSMSVRALTLPAR